MGRLSSRRSKLIAILIILAVVILALCYYNADVRMEFSSEPGFYDDALTLQIYGGRLGSIHYTLDGSKPTLDSELYTDGIELTDATELPNRASMRTDTTVGFDIDFIKSFDDSLENPYAVPDYNVDKIYLVRAVYFDVLGHERSEITGSYYLNFDEKPAYQDMAIVSITTDEANLWDSETGIYTTGVYYENYKNAVLSGEDTVDEQLTWKTWDANYHQEGMDWERPCAVEVFDEQHNRILSQACGLRIQGKGSTGENQKGLSIFAREEYSGQETFDADLTESGYKQHRYILTSGGQDQYVKINDYLIQNAVKDMKVATMDYRPCMLFLNGEFWGMYYITEPYNAEYVAAHYDVSADNVIIYKNKNIQEGTEEDNIAYQEMYDFMTTADMSDPDNFAYACEIVDIYSLIDYYVIMHYIGRIGDWPDSNEAAWRIRDPDYSNEYSDGKWRWMLFDLNGPDWELDVTRVDDTADNIMSAMWLRLIVNEEFKNVYAQRYWKLAKENFNPDIMDEAIDNYVDKYQAALELSNKRFFGDEYTDTIINRTENELKYFFLRRRDVTPLLISQICGAQYNDLFDE